MPKLDGGVPNINNDVNTVEDGANIAGGLLVVNPASDNCVEDFVITTAVCDCLEPSIELNVDDRVDD
uniref:Uncharacterized protein n=1 Tax=Romanomermis culicivorax TaxID=13658 RepID=A0A915JIY9_ROMCU